MQSALEAITRDRECVGEQIGRIAAGFRALAHTSSLEGGPGSREFEYSILAECEQAMQHIRRIQQLWRGEVCARAYYAVYVEGRSSTGQRTSEQ